MLYHGSNPMNRASIILGGLKPTARNDKDLGYTCPRGVYLATDAEEASYFGSDIWEVNTEGLPILVDPDSYNANGIDDNYYSPVAISPERIRLIRTGRMQ